MKFLQTISSMATSKLGEWSSSVNYTVGDIVSYNGQIYVARTNNINQQPDTNADDWRVYTDTLPYDTATDPALNAAVTTAIIDAYGGIIITLTGAGNNQTLQAPTDTSAGRKFTVVNDDASGANTIDIIDGTQTITINAGEAQSYVRDGSVWAAVTAVDATNIAFTPYGNIAATNVQSAIQELDDEKVGVVDQQQIYYVGKHGNDSNDGLTKEKAFLTFTAAIAAASAQTPSSSNIFTIKCCDGGIYSESTLIIPGYVYIDAPNATFQPSSAVNTVQLSANSTFRAHTILQNNGGPAAVVGENDTGNRTVHACLIQATGSATGVVNFAVTTDGKLGVIADLIIVETGKAISDNSLDGRIGFDIGGIFITGNNGVGVYSGGTGALTGEIGFILEEGTPTGTIGIDVDSGTVDINAAKIDTDTAYDIAVGATLNIHCAELIGTQTNAGTIELINGSNGVNITGNIITSGDVTGANINGTTSLQLNGTDINTGGTLSNVAYLDQTNIFTTGVMGMEGSAGSAQIEIGTNVTGDQFAFLDLVGDTTYSDYGLRLIRNNSGANTSSILDHRGTGDLLIRAQDAGTVKIQTSSLTRWAADSSGNVCVGAETFNSLFEIAGADPILTIRDTSTAGADGNSTLRIAESGASGTVDSYWDLKLEGQLSGADDFVIYDKTTERFRIDSTGNLGIGTNTINELVTMDAGTGVSSFIQIVNGTTSGTADNNGLYLGLASNAEGFIGTRHNAGLSIQTNNSTAITIDTSGNVGVQETTPLAPLHVSGQAYFGTEANLARDIIMRRNATSIGGMSTTNNVLSLFGGATRDSHIAITTAGDVGIQTIAPDGTLHVHTATAGTLTPNGNYDDLIIENSAAGGITIATPNNVAGGIAFADPDSATQRVILYDHNSDKLQVFNQATAQLTLDVNNNLGLGTTTFGTSADTVVAIAGSTAPTTSPTDTVQFWAEDVTAGGGDATLVIRDEDGEIHLIHQTYGCLYISSSAETTISTINTPVLVSGTTTEVTSSGDITVSAAGRFTYTGTRDREFQVNASISMTSAGNNQDISWYLAKNGTIITSSRQQRRVGTGTDVGNLGLTCVPSLSTNDYLEIYVENNTGTANLTAEYMNFNIQSIS